MLSLYEISTFIRLKNIKTKYITDGHKSLDKYLHVTPTNDYGLKINSTIHKLVALSFIPNPENKSTIDHIDRNRENNHVSNLRRATHSEQIANRTLTSKSKNNIGRSIY